MTDESTRSTISVAVDLADPAAVTPRPVVWHGTSIMVRHHPDGSVSASCRGLLAVGPNDSMALRELSRMVKDADRADRV